jgi:hypothetical protein
MSRIKRVLKQTVTGYIPDGSGNSSPPPLLNQIKDEPLKQEKAQEPVPFALTEGERAGERIMSQEVSKMPEEEHDEKELEDDDDEKPDCFGGLDGEGGYEDDDSRCKHCDLAEECQSESPDEGETEEPDAEEPLKPQRVKEAGPSKVESSDKPDKFTITKMVKVKTTREDGSIFMKTIPKTVGDVFTGEPPGKDDIEAILVPQYGGGEYSVINQTSKKVVKRYKFDGPARDPDEPVAEVAPQLTPISTAFQGLAAQPVQQTPQQPGVPPQPQQNPAMEKIQAALGLGSMKAVDQLTAMAAKYAEENDMDKFNRVMDALTQAMTGQKQTNSSDRLTDMMIDDRKMMMQMLLEKGKGKESSSSDIVRETMSTMKEMFGLAKEFAPQGEDTGVAMVREVSGVVKDSLKDVTDTVIQVTGSRPLKQVEEPAPEKVVYKCERCGHVVDPRFAVCPYCGVKFTGAVSTPKAQPPVVIGQTAPIETFRKPIPPLPPEVKERMDYLKRVAVFIQESHDPVVKGSALFKAAGPEEKVALLFTANFGYGNIMKLAQPWRHSNEIPEGDAIFKVIESANGRLWINKFFGSIRETAREDGFILDQGTIDHYLAEINKYSVVKFSFRPKPGPEGPASATAPPELKQVKGKTVAMSECPVCHESVPTLELQDHLFKKHPPIKITNPRAIAAIQRGAAVLPRGREESVMLPPPNSPETTAPNGNGSEEEDGT